MITTINQRLKQLWSNSNCLFWRQKFVSTFYNQDTG